MEDILTELSRPSWWFTVCIVGLIINMMSAYLKEPIDKVLSSVSKRWRQRVAKSKEEREQEIQGLLADPLAIINAKIDTLYNLVVTLFCITIGLLIVNIYGQSYIGNIGSSLSQIGKISTQAFVVIFTLAWASPRIWRGIYMESLLTQVSKMKKNKNQPYGIF